MNKDVNLFHSLYDPRPIFQPTDYLPSKFSMNDDFNENYLTIEKLKKFISPKIYKV